MDDVVGASLFGQLIEGLQVTCKTSPISSATDSIEAVEYIPRTSAIHRIRVGPFWITLPLLGRSGVAPGAGPDGVAPLERGYP